MSERSGPGSLAGRVALVTGAGRGIGRAIALALAARGAHVVGVARTAAELDETVARVAAAGGVASAHRCELRDEAAVRDLVATIGREHDRLDVVVNNAGLNVVRPVRDLGLAEWRAVLDTNLTAPFVLCREALPWLEASPAPGGVIVNVSSVAARPDVEKFEGFAAYAASKYGLLGLGEILALEVAAAGVRVYTVCPGSTRTEMLAGTVTDPGPTLEPAEVAALVADLADGTAAEPSGAVIDVRAPA